MSRSIEKWKDGSRAIVTRVTDQYGAGWTFVERQGADQYGNVEIMRDAWEKGAVKSIHIPIVVLEGYVAEVLREKMVKKLQEASPNLESLFASVRIQ